MFVGEDFLHKIYQHLLVIYQTICGCQAVRVGGSETIRICKDKKFISEVKKMSVQYSEKSLSYLNSTANTNPNIKTPFGIEDILLINNNNNSQNVNKNSFPDIKSSMKSAVKNSETEEFRKILNER
jgi:hypothetical protein